MAYLRPASRAAILGLVVMLAGCSPGPLIDRLPGDMGLPAGTPARPIAPYDYPAVHDMPAERSTQPMSAEEQLKMEKDLVTLRDRQAQEATRAPADKAVPPAKSRTAKSQAAADPAVKKKPADVIVVPPAGASSKP